ncbi:TIGR03621 family F420-dependent LLM class oxidoreductase [Mycobacterium sp. smrl_JER01]|uniref:TIGR03621 family F420-dependent LLM class oxidoreductase n=1 Tax=Mycobacterium sp. smrl_JER01 TaxID=3402633 RepID=UPI003AC32197
MRFGLTAALPRSAAQSREFALRVETAGIDVMTFADHLAPTVSPFVGAAATAVVTSRLRVGTLVVNNDLRHPVDTARESASLATVSDGRFELGIGAGHMKSEYDAAGIAFDDGATRVSRLIESVTVIRALLAGEPVDFSGKHHRVCAGAGEIVAPPAHHVPILVGGNGTRVLQLAGHIADIAGFAGITHNRDATRVRLSHFDGAGLADRIAVVRTAAGERFDQIELNALIQAVVVTDDRESAAVRLSEALGADPALLLDSPFVLIGTHEQMADQLVARQREFGVSYWTVFDEWAGRASALPDVAEVISLLR